MREHPVVMVPIALLASLCFFLLPSAKASPQEPNILIPPAKAPAPQELALPSSEARLASSRLLKTALRDTGELTELIIAAEQAARILARGNQADRLLALVREARWLERVDPSAAQVEILRELRELAKDLAFEPRIEADLPVGWPSPTPIGEWRVKAYPAYRMGQTDASKARSNGAFWILFQHIQSNSIPMTAPVEMTFEPKGESVTETKMAFLYQSTSEGELGLEGKVLVTDVEPGFTVTRGCRGAMNNSRLERERLAALAWIERHPEWEAAGPMRVMGYNSPMVPYDQRYFEVEIPVRKVPRTEPRE